MITTGLKIMVEGSDFVTGSPGAYLRVCPLTGLQCQDFEFIKAEAKPRRSDTWTAMDTFYFNKIAGAVLASLLVLVGVNTAIHLFYPKGTANLSKGHIVVAPEAAAPAPEAAAAAKPEEKDPPVEGLLASANVEAGKSAAKVCGACHNFAKGAGTKVGPDLYDVVDRAIGAEPGFSYSSALKQHNSEKWTFQNLYEWIKNPKAFIPGNNMGFGGVKNPQERANIIAYLDKESDHPAPLPQK